MQESLLPESYPIDQIEKSVQPQSQIRLWLRRLLGSLALCVIGVCVFMIVSSGLHGWSVYRAGTALQDLAGGDPLGSDLPQMQVLVDETVDGLAGLSDDMWFWRPLLKRLLWLPEYGPTLAAAPEFVAVGKDLGVVASDGLALVTPLLDADQPLSISLQNVSIPEATMLFAEHGTDLGRMAGHVDLASAQLATLDASALHPRLAEPVLVGQKLLPVLGPGLRSLAYVDGFVGREKPQTFLILVQNNDELRATGGFISAFGRLVLVDGELAELKFADSYWVRRDDVEYVGAPKPMQQYMGTQLMMFRDANWSPDFPTTAQAVKGIFRQDTGIEVEGVITVDMNALRLITDVLAPLSVEGIDEALTGETVVEAIKRIWDRPVEGDDDADFGQWWMERKSFIPKLADAVLARAIDERMDYVDLALVSLQALDQRAVQVWIDQPEIARELAKLEWNGSVHAPDDADFIGLVDSNLGYNKVDGVIERSIDYEVDWPQAGEGGGERAVASLTVTYHHPVDLEAHRCDITPRYGTSYDDMAARCYFNYVRLYVPAGSELVRVDGVLDDSVESRRGEGDTQVFSGYFVLPPGDQHRVTFTYHLPERLSLPVADNAAYPLLVRRQSGTEPLSLQIDVAGRRLTAEVQSGVKELLVQ